MPLEQIALPSSTPAFASIETAKRESEAVMPAVEATLQHRRPTANPARNPYSHYLRVLISELDDALRRSHGVREFSEDPQCILRIAIRRTTNCTHLADGSTVPCGAAIIDLHLWNEHLPDLSSRSTGLGRATRLRRQIEASLEELTWRLVSEPSFAEIRALRARAAFVPRRRLAKLLRVARSFEFGTDAADTHRCFTRQMHDFWENFLIWALAWAYNPNAPRRNRVFRARCELWVSREALLMRYHRRSSEARKGLPPLATVSNEQFRDHDLSLLAPAAPQHVLVTSQCVASVG
jgi:hypothetical protein